MNLAKTLPINSRHATAYQTFFQKLKVVDWQAIFLRLTSSHERHKFTLTQNVLVIRQYRLFLFLLHEYPSLKMVPNQDIDAVLHAHTADVSQFEKDCENLFGVFLQHIPEVGRKEAERKEWLLTFARTQTLFEQNFGQGAMGSSVAACCEILLI
ncbi:MAG: hypothetical protein PUP91_13220 [Rhizonema sp. PD37]|nr:hypothetical protein [Rhizonema sp. PD37]